MTEWKASPQTQAFKKGPDAKAYRRKRNHAARAINVYTMNQGEQRWGNNVQDNNKEVGDLPGKELQAPAHQIQEYQAQ